MFMFACFGTCLVYFLTITSSEMSFAQHLARMEHVTMRVQMILMEEVRTSECSMCYNLITLYDDRDWNANSFVSYSLSMGFKDDLKFCNISKWISRPFNVVVSILFVADL